MTQQEERKDDFFAKYLAYTSGTEVPTFFNRWSCIVALGALAGQDVWLRFRDGKIYPNVYAMLVGDPGTRKSTAIKAVKSLLRKSGYDTFAAERTSKEKFVEDLATLGARNAMDMGDMIDRNLFATLDATGTSSPCFIAADEFNNFFSNNLLDFVSLLGEFWDYTGNYEARIKNGTSVSIPNPNVSILGGNTIENLNRAFPPEIIGQGFLSRLLLIYGERTGIKIAFPEVIEEEQTQEIVKALEEVKAALPVGGEMVMTPAAKKLLEKIYATWNGIEDPRFSYYAGRRFIHLLKLVMIHAIADCTTVMEVVHVRRANTVLRRAEQDMPRALGELGRSRNSIVAHKIVQILENHLTGLDIHEIWERVASDLEKVDHLSEIIKGLKYAGKIQIAGEKILLEKRVAEKPPADTIEQGYLLPSEE